LLPAAALATLCAIGGAGTMALAVPPSPLLGPYAEPNCFDPSHDPEFYGPTDVNVQAGNNRVTVNENDHGTITVFKYPNPSYYNQVKYFTLYRDAHGNAVVQFPNEGSFAGIWYRTSAGTGFAWLRDWPTTQQYNSHDTPVPVTVYHSPSTLGLTVTSIDMASVTSVDAFEREFWVDRASGSPVTEARLVYFENFNPVANRHQGFPDTDWCTTQFSDQQAAYDAASHSIVHSWQGGDQASNHPTSVAFAFGWEGADQQHQVGNDGYDPASTRAVPDGYDQAGNLGGSNMAVGQVTGALSTPLDFGPDGRARARMTIAGGQGSGAAASAISALQQTRSRTFDSELAASRNDWLAWLGQTKLPKSSDPRVIEVAKRSLITLRLAIAYSDARDEIAIVASSNTQAPYAEDWTRDGSYMNQVLDMNGFHDLVTKHNRFYARIQASPGNPSPFRPVGNWAMTSYADGVDGGPIPWEIDETGFATWALWNHYAYLSGAAAKSYLDEVYPAIQNAANYMTLCRDPGNGMQCQQSEDDNYTPTQTMHGAITNYLGLESAIGAAAVESDVSPAVGQWSARLTELRGAIDALYDPQLHAYQENHPQPNFCGGNVCTTDFGDGGWMLWPGAFKAFSDPTMIGEASRVRSTMDSNLAGSRGGYEAKGLLGLAHAWSSPTADQYRGLTSTLSYMAASLPTPTGLFGESWRRYDGKPHPIEDQPHVWEHCLFYLSAIQIDGAQAFTPQQLDYVSQHARPQPDRAPTTTPDAPVALPLVLALAAALGVLLVGSTVQRRAG
jgi:GH15 family glucan-1,4-alpha-glucosidase